MPWGVRLPPASFSDHDPPWLSWAFTPCILTGWSINSRCGYRGLALTSRYVLLLARQAPPSRLKASCTACRAVCAIRSFPPARGRARYANDGSFRHGAARFLLMAVPGGPWKSE